MKRIIGTTGMIGWIAAAVGNFFAGKAAAVDDADLKNYQQVAYTEAQTKEHGRFYAVARGRSFYGKTIGTRVAMREAKKNRCWLAKQPK